MQKLILFFLVFCFDSSNGESTSLIKVRSKRQSLCSNGGTNTGLSCTATSSCQTYAGPTASCINGVCCVGGTSTSTQCSGNSIYLNRTCNSYTDCQYYMANSACVSGYCCSTKLTNLCTSGGTDTGVRCTSTSDCQTSYGPSTTCTNGVCCSTSTTGSQCSNGGTLLGTGCSTYSDCQSRYPSTVSYCLNGYCCTSSSTGTLPQCSSITSYQYSQYSCSSYSDCSKYGTNLACVMSQCELILDQFHL